MKTENQVKGETSYQIWQIRNQFFPPCHNKSTKKEEKKSIKSPIIEIFSETNKRFNDK
jgi:hypothetical protein